ncbi:MAG: T9SS type A sorting domain-containing protein [Saprospiraceae bacterium]|nr:T9SS type A sorting domain-containing protein [Saprospiraceae bacterium]
MRYLLHWLSPMLLLLLSYKQVHGQDTIVVRDGDITTGNYRWTNDQVYLLDGPVVLESGRLDIEPGTHIIGKADPSNSAFGTSGLHIRASAQLYALGTAELPIILAGEYEGYLLWATPNWSGLSIEGRSTQTSGILTYLSIRLAGYSDSLQIGSSLTLKNVDGQTTINHIEVFRSSGDGVRLSGGNANLAHIAVSYVNDDAFDFDMGWSGQGIYWFANGIHPDILNPLSDTRGNFGIEGKSYLSEADTLISKPSIFHASIIGEQCGGFFQGESRGLGFFSKAGGTVANSFVLHLGDFGLEVEDLPGSADSYGFLVSEDLDISHNVWHNIGRERESEAGEGYFAGPGGFIKTTEFSADPQAKVLLEHLQARSNVIGNTGILKNLEGSCLAIDPRPDPANDYQDLANLALPNTPFFNQFEAQAERGAFSNELWIKGWTALDTDESILLGEEGYGRYYYKQEKLSFRDTIIVSCEELPALHDSLLFIFPCRPFQYQLGAAHRKSNPRRRRIIKREPGARSIIEEYAFIEEWQFISSDQSGCSAPQTLDLAILVLDTIPPIIHPIPDGLGGMTAVLEDCDESWIREVKVDTSISVTGDTMLSYHFIAEDYVGNRSELTLNLTIGNVLLPWYADLDGDGFGNDELVIMASDSIPGFVHKGGDCNDSDEEAYPGGEMIFNSPVDRACSGSTNYDICAGALQITVDDSCRFGRLDLANPSIYPTLNKSCLPPNYRDVWATFDMPASGGVHIQIIPDFYKIIDPDGFSRIIMMEIYVGDCHNLEWQSCTTADGDGIFFDYQDESFRNKTIYLRIMEAGNKTEAPFTVCVIDLENKASNDACTNATPLFPGLIDSCTPRLISNLNARRSQGFINSSCHEVYEPADIWFQIHTAGADSIYLHIDTIANSKFKQPIAVLYAGQCGFFEEVQCFSYENLGPDLTGWIETAGFSETMILRLYDASHGQGNMYLTLCHDGLLSLDVENKDLANQIRLFPNPANDQAWVSLEFPMTNLHIHEVRILDIRGKPIRSTSTDVQEQNLGTIPIHIAGLADGIYFVQLQTSEGLITQKLLVFK